MPVTARPFAVQFQEAIDFLNAKLPEASVAWDDLAGPVHSKVFTVAGATTADLARDMQAACAKALAEGGTITSFRKDFDRIVKQYGWSYNGSRGWRTGVIFNTNMRTAHMAGRWAQIQANKADRPYLQYRTAGDARVRPMHKQWNGKIYSVDDVFWHTHYPPNGWGCRCTVRSYSEGDLQARGLQVATPFKMVERDVVTRDGEIKDRVPVGIDPGWDHNVGRAWIAPELSLGEKLARLPREVQGAVVDKTISPAFQTVIADNWKTFQTTVETTGRPRGDTQVLGFLDSAMLDSIATQVPGLTIESTAVTAMDKRTAHLAGRHKADKAPQQVWPQAAINDLPLLLRDYRAVLWDVMDQVLVVIPDAALPGQEETNRAPKITLRPNVTSKTGTSVQVVSLGSSEIGNLKDRNRYRVLVGQLR